MASDPSSPAPTAPPAPGFASLFHAVNGLRNGRAIVALLGCMFAGVVVASLLLAMAGTLGGLAWLLAFVVWFVAVGTGVNAAGLLQMDSARATAPRSLAEALANGLLCIPKLIVLALVFVAVEIAVLIAIAVLLVVCKIPFLGPLLFVVAFPLSVVAAGVTITGLFLCMVLSLPAVWQGATVTRALAQTLAIIKSRLVEAVLLLVLVGFLSIAVGLIVFGVIGAGFVPTLAMSVAIVGLANAPMESLVEISRIDGGGHAVAGAIGGALLWALAASLVGQVYLLGLSLVYLRVTDGLDAGASEATLRSGLADARRRAAGLGARARQGMQRDRAAAAAGSGSASPADPAPAGADASHAFARSADNPFAALASADEPTTIGPGATGADATFAFAPAPPSSRPQAAPPRWQPPPGTAPAPLTDSPPLPEVPLPGIAEPPPPASSGATPLPAVTTCPQCLAPVLPDDAFCAVCGHRLKLG